MKKRLVAFLLVLIMVLGMLPVSAFAADDGVSPQALESNETQTIKYQILYVGDEFNIGYNYGASVNKTYTCQYSTGHSGFNHSILISEFRNVGVPALKDQLDSGYEFVGWAKEAKENPTIYDFNVAGTTATQTTYTIYLVAKKTNPTPTYMYYLYYKYNDGTNSTWLTEVPDRPTTATTFTFYVNTAKLKDRSGYDHIGWADKADAVTAKYKGGEAIVLTKDDPTKTIYAVWMPFFELKYDANGGTGAPASQTRTAGHPTVNRVTFTVPNQTPSKEGYTFKGWADSAAATTAQYQPGDTVDVKHENSPKTVYAVWEGSDPIPVPSYDDLKSAIGKIQVMDVSTPSCGTENYDLIDNTQSEPFNWTKTARLDQLGKYDVTIKTAPYVAKYNSEKSKTHELNNANQTTLKLVISYENNTWKLDDGLRVIEVKHSEQTPPTDKPAKPTENDVTGVVVDIVCVTTTGTHDTVQYPLGFATTPQHTIGEVASDGAGGYICPVTVRTAWFVQQASNLRWKVQHTPTAQTITFNLTYDKNSKTWVKPAANPRIEATHEMTPPTKPIITGRQEYIRVICKNEPNKERNYVPKFGRYTESDPAVQKVNGVWTYTITILRDKHIEEFNKDFPGHEDTDPNAVTTMSWVWKDAEWKLVPVNGLQTVGAIIEVTCEPEAPTADELKKLEMAVQVKCVVDAAQQHTSAYGLLGEYDKDYFVGEPKKVGDDWLCDISYDPDPYVAEFNKAFPTLKHIQNDEKIVPVTLIWVGGSWQIKTQGRVLVTEVYTVTFNSYGGTPVPPAQEVEYGHTATKPADPTLKGYTFAFWYLGEDEQNATAYDFNTPVTENITLTAKWNINKYTVTFDSYGGTPVPPAQEVEYGLTATEPAAPEKTGYTFDGWYLGDEKYDFSAAVEQNITLTAKWTLNTYTVTFDPNGGNELAEADKTKAVKIGEAYGELPTPTRKGYNFAGWYTEAEEGTVVTADTTVSAMTDHTLYAHWEAKKANVHIMIFKSNDLGTPIVDRAYTTDAVYGDTLDLAEIDPSSYLDFDFEIDGGWYDDGLFNLYKKYVSGEQANKPAALTKLQITGNWQNLKLIVTELVPVVYFKSAEALAEYQNDHSKVENIIFTTKARVGSTLPTADAPTATRDGYTFTFWSREGQIGTDVTGQTVNGWTNLVANWEARTDTPYTVEHYLENLDGSYALDTTEPLKGTTDTTVTAAAKSYDNFTYDSTVPGTVASGNIAGDGSLVLKLFYTRNTYDYTVRHIKQLPDGSYDEANAEVETLSGKFEALAAVTAKDYGSHYPTNDADTKQNIKIEKGLTIDVKYDLDEHTLTFETNGGSAINPVTVRHGNAVARPADPTKDKYTFIGWYADPEFTEEYDFATVLEADKTIYAKFELTSTPIGDIYVRYDVLHIKQLPDGTYDLANAEVEHLSAKKDTTVTAVIKDYRATHHVNVNRTLSKLIGTAIQPYMGVDGKPVYTILSVYYDLDFHTLTFDTMGGSKIAPETVRHGLTVAKPKDPVNGGYIFDGWYTDKTYRTPYNFATPLTQDTTIYAKWFLIVLPGVTVKKNTPKLNTADHFAYVQGYPDGTVKPAGNITRAETAAILFRLMDEGSRKTYYSTTSGFRDVASGSWYNTYVATLNNAGVITDSSNGYFRPNEAITRAELAAMLANFTETAGAANYFNDVSASYWAANAIAICAKLGWINGYPDGTFRPDKNVTRAELMAMINRATGRAPKSADAFLPGMKTWIDNTADKWYYLDVQEATNSHSYTVKGSETWTALTSDPNWSLYE